MCAYRILRRWSHTTTCYVTTPIFYPNAGVLCVMLLVSFCFWHCCSSPHWSSPLPRHCWHFCTLPPPHRLLSPGPLSHGYRWPWPQNPASGCCCWTAPSSILWWIKQQIQGTFLPPFIFSQIHSIYIPGPRRGCKHQFYRVYSHLRSYPSSHRPARLEPTRCSKSHSQDQLPRLVLRHRRVFLHPTSSHARSYSWQSTCSCRHIHRFTSRMASRTKLCLSPRCLSLSAAPTLFKSPKCNSPTPVPCWHCSLFKIRQRRPGLGRAQHISTFRAPVLGCTSPWRSISDCLCLVWCLVGLPLCHWISRPCGNYRAFCPLATQSPGYRQRHPAVIF